MKLIGTRSGKRYSACNGIGRYDMNRACEKSDDSPMPITFLRLTPSRGYPASLVIPDPGSSDSPDGKKNSLRKLRYGALDFLRPQVPLGPRPLLRRHAHLPRTGDPACSVPKVRQGEAGEVSLPGQQSVLYQEVCLLRWQALQYLHGQGCRPGITSGPQDGQRSGKAVYAGETPPCRQSQTQSYRH
jgi:hypothetical protein